MLLCLPPQGGWAQRETGGGRCGGGKSSDILVELNVELMIFHYERSQNSLVQASDKDDSWMPTYSREVFLACSMGRRPSGKPRTRWKDYTVYLIWLGKAWISLCVSWRTWLGKEGFEHLRPDCFPCNSDGQKSRIKWMHR